MARHPPSRGTVSYSKQPGVPLRSHSKFVSADLAYYAPLLNRYSAAAMVIEVRKRVGRGMGKLSLGRNLGDEQLDREARLRGEELDVRRQEDLLAIGGLRHARDAVARLHLVANFGQLAHDNLWPVICANPKWPEL